MNELEKVLSIEYKLLLDKEREYLVEHENLPAGSVQKKLIKGKEYYYRQFREGRKVKSVYVKRSNLEDIEEKIVQRKMIEHELSEIKNRKKALEGVVDKDRLNVLIIENAVRKIVKEYPKITRVALFGSRAESRYRDDSDVDLLFESSEPISLMTQTDLRMKLEDELALSVDLVHGPIKKGNFLEVGKEVELYAAQG